MNSSSLHSIRTTFVSVMNNSQERENLAENRFILNLTRMSGENISAVTPECILEFLVHLQNSSVSELQFIEEAYTSIIFEDDDFMDRFIQICSVEVLIKRFEEAKEGGDTEFLKAFRVLHRRARIEVFNTENKLTIRSFIVQRKSLNEMKHVKNIITTCIEYLTNYSGSSMSSLMRRILSSVADERNIQAIQGDLSTSSVTLPDMIPER
jgi:hypothetical protein